MLRKTIATIQKGWGQLKKISGELLRKCPILFKGF